jgi:hypothetical protein
MICDVLFYEVSAMKIALRSDRGLLDEVNVLGTGASREVFCLGSAEQQHTWFGLMECIMNPSNGLLDTLDFYQSMSIVRMCMGESGR